MRKKLLMVFLAFVVVLGIGLPIVDSWANGESVYIIPVSGEITPAMATFFRDSIKEAERENAKAILVEISTLGGRVDAAFEMKQAIEGSKIPIIIYIDDRALSAGALISISAPRIIMAPGSHMGSAEPIPYSVKAVAAIRGEFEAAAERNGRDKTIAAAMVDKEIEIPGLSPAGSLLDITADTAKEYGYAEEVLDGRENVLKYLGFEDEKVVIHGPNPLIRLAQFLTKSNIASLILTIGIIALTIEIFTKGFGVPGIVGIVALALYFGSNLIAGYSQWWPVILFIVGVILLIVEVFIPGFGIPGISGITSMLIGIVFAAPDPARGLRNLGIALVLVIIATPILIHYLKRSGSFERFVLSDVIIDKPEDKGDNRDMELLNKRGVVLTTLRPSGIISIDGMRLDAVSQGEFIPPGTQVKVVKSSGLSVVVSKYEDNLKEG